MRVVRCDNCRRETASAGRCLHEFNNTEYVTVEMRLPNTNRYGSGELCIDCATRVLLMFEGKSV